MELDATVVSVTWLNGASNRGTPLNPGQMSPKERLLAIEVADAEITLLHFTLVARNNNYSSYSIFRKKNRPFFDATITKMVKFLLLANHI